MGETSITFTGTTGVERDVQEADVRFVPGERFESRLKLTEFLLDGGRERYGLWEPPDIRILGNETRHITSVKQEGRPDLVSFDFYDTVDLWWAIMYVNNIFLPIRDLVAGKLLIIPFKAEIERALQRVRE